MCLIEELGYSAANRDKYCNKCVIFNQIGQCSYLKQCEMKMKKTVDYNIFNIVDRKLDLKIIYSGDGLCVFKKGLK